MCKSKRFIDKIMFLCVDAQPRWDTVWNQYFDGKIGMYPFITIQMAKRASRAQSPKRGRRDQAGGCRSGSVASDAYRQGAPRHSCNFSERMGRDGP
jgi:hypothetical protein